MFHSVEIFSIPLLNIGLLLGGAEIFTNSIERFGYHLGVSESATGSILAAVGTALPETMIPVIAIVSVLLGRGDQAVADAIGVGAILGAPFMLATIAMTLIGASVLLFGSRRDAGPIFKPDVTALRRDLSFFLIGYPFAVVAAFVPSRALSIGIALGLVVLYLVYIKQTLAAGQLIEGDDLESLHLSGLLAGDERPFPAFGSDIIPIDEPPVWMVVTQAVFALLVIIAGAHLFVTEVAFFSTEVLDVPAALIALLLAPLATELPEKFNSGIWISEGKDTLAIGNITGGMVFQGTLPATLGILFTSWDLGVSWGSIGFLNTLSAILALIGGGTVLVRTQFMPSNRMRPAPFLVAGLLYVVFITVVIYHVVILGIAASH